MSVAYVGPFEDWQVVIDGWEVPLLTANPQTGGKVFVGLDRRYGIELSVKEAELVLPFVAHAIAIASGYACHPNEESEPKSLPVLRPRRLIGLGSIDGETP